MVFRFVLAGRIEPFLLDVQARSLAELRQELRTDPMLEGRLVTPEGVVTSCYAMIAARSIIAVAEVEECQ